MKIWVSNGIRTITFRTDSLRFRPLDNADRGVHKTYMNIADEEHEHVLIYIGHIDYGKMSIRQNLSFLTLYIVFITVIELFTNTSNQGEGVNNVVIAYAQSLFCTNEIKYV